MSFDPELCQKYVEMLIRHDELERAQLVLENVPAFYRLFPPNNLLQLKGELLAASITAHHYTTSVGDDIDELERKHPGLDEHITRYLDEHIRARLLRDKIKQLNEQGVTPHIVDMGPGHFILPRALLRAGYKFTYWDVGLNYGAKARTREMLKEVLSQYEGLKSPVIFLGLEIIEHLRHTEDLAIEAVGVCKRWPEFVMLSTPFCTYRVMQDDEDWRRTPLEHLRAYTPKEFQAEAHRIFPHYVWQLHIGEPANVEPMSLVGTRIDLVKPSTDTK